MYAPGLQIDGSSYWRQGLGCFDEAPIGNFQDPWQGDIAESERAGAAYRTRHVGHAIMDHLVDYERWLAMGGGACCGNTAALVDCHVN